MPKPYSIDLRHRVVEYLKKTQDKKKASELFQVGNVWLKRELLPMLSPGHVLIVDNASFHKSTTTQNLVESYGCKLLFLPPYSPDLNPIEKCWANMKKKIRELLPTASTLSEAFDSAILSMTT